MSNEKEVTQIIEQFIVHCADSDLIELHGDPKYPDTPIYLYVALQLIIQGPDGLLFPMLMGYALALNFDVSGNQLNTPGVMAASVIEILRPHAEALDCTALIAEYDREFNPKTKLTGVINHATLQ